MNLNAVFNFDKSRIALANLGKLLTCEICHELSNNPRRHVECGYLICSCVERDSCPGCGKKCTKSNTILDYNVNSIIDATKTIKTLIQSQEIGNEDITKTSSKSHEAIEMTDKTSNENSKNLKVGISSNENVLNPNTLQKGKSEGVTEKSLPFTKTNSSIGHSSEEKDTIQTKSIKSNKNQNLKELTASLKAIMKRNTKGETKLHAACVKGDLKKVEEFLKAGADPCTKDNAGWTPLHEAVSKGHIDIVKLLLEAGALVNVPGGFNNTPLHDAALNNNIESARLLIAFGADPHLRNIDGNTPLSMASSKEMEIILNERKPSVDVKTMKNTRYKHDIVLYGFKLPEKTLKKLYCFVEHFKLKKVTVFSSDVTHIIVSTIDRTCSPEVDILNGILKGKWIVDSEWLAMCLKNNLLEDPSHYEIKGTTRFPESFAPKKSRENAEKMQPSLFNGCHFYFSCVDKIIIEGIKFTKSQLSSFITRGDGLILTREPNPEAIPLHERTVPYHANPGMFAKCSHFILYSSGQHEPLLKYNMPHVKSLPVSWLINCIENFSLLES